MLIAVPEDDVDGQRLHDYRMTADEALEIRIPVKAGTRLVAVAFTDAAPTPERTVRSRGRSGPGELRTTTRPASTRSTSPARSTAGRREDTPSRRQIFVCQPAGARDERPARDAS